MSFSPEAALAYLRRAHAQNRLAHAYLISGAPGSGKLQLATRLAAELNGASVAVVARGQAPDVVITEPASKSRRIVIEQIRKLERALQMRAAQGRKNIAIIRDAERMQAQAANAFLKTLEEPPQNSLLLLLTSLPEALPDTIISRCLSLPLRNPSQADPSPEEQELLGTLCAEAANGAGPVPRAYRISQEIQRLLGKMRDDIRSQHAEILRAEEQRYRTTTDGAWLDDREDYYKALTESVYRERRTRLLENLYIWWAEILRAKVGEPKLHLPGCGQATARVAERLSATELLQRLRRLDELRHNLNTTAQEALVLEVACLQVFG